MRKFDQCNDFQTYTLSTILRKMSRVRQNRTENCTCHAHKLQATTRTENIFQQFAQQHAFSLPLFAAPSSSFLSRGLVLVDLFEDFSGAVVRMASTIFHPVVRQNTDYTFSGLWSKCKIDQSKANFDEKILFGKILHL